VWSVSVTFGYCDHIGWKLEYFENNFTAEYLKAYARADPNLSYLAQREHPKIRVE